MLKGYGHPVPENSQVIRCDLSMPFDFQKIKLYADEWGFYGEDIDDEKISHVTAMYDALMDFSHTFSKAKTPIFELVNDLGVRFLKYGDASGSTFGTGDYRALMVKTKDSDYITINIGILATGKTVNDPIFGNTDGKSVLIVSINDGKRDEMAVQINLNKFLILEGAKATLFHNAAVMMKGARKEKLLGILDKETDGLVIDKMINFGAFNLEKTVYADSPDFSKIIFNIISYALIRNKYKRQISVESKQK